MASYHRSPGHKADVRLAKAGKGDLRPDPGKKAGMTLLRLATTQKGDLTLAKAEKGRMRLARRLEPVQGRIEARKAGIIHVASSVVRRPDTFCRT
jgi:hypothetical protein